MKYTSERFIGKKFGKLTVFSFDEKNKKGQSYWLCRCDCGKEKSIRGDHLLNSKTKSCGCNNRGSKNVNWKGYGEIGGWIWTGYKRNAKTKKRVFDISIKDGWDLFLQQNRKCSLSGVDLYFSPNTSNRHGTNASLDRIDSKKGYTIDNVQWVTKKINMAKQNVSQNEFIEMCKLVSQNNL